MPAMKIVPKGKSFEVTIDFGQDQTFFKEKMDAGELDRLCHIWKKVKKARESDRADEDAATYKITVGAQTIFTGYSNAKDMTQALDDAYEFYSDVTHGNVEPGPFFHSSLDVRRIEHA